MPSDKALETADLILNGKSDMMTKHGRKRREGLADLIERQLLGYSPDDHNPGNEAVCPNCNSRGGLVARTDAYVNRPIPADGHINWTDPGDVTTFDETIYECTNCDETVERREIEQANNFEIK